MNDNLSSVTALSGCGSLLLVWLDGNPQLSDLRPLSSLTGLEGASAAGCSISDPAFVKTMPLLSAIGLNNNQITSVESLVDPDVWQMGIGLQGNALDQDSICTYIPQIQMQGNNVLYDGYCHDGNHYDLIVQVQGSGSVYPIAQSYAPGATAYLNATDTAFATVFSEWRITDGANTSTLSTNPSISITMDGNKSLLAKFTRIPVNLTNLAKGVITSPDNLDGNYYVGKAVSIVAMPYPGWAFVGWLAPTSTTVNPISLTWNDQTTVKQITAQFAPADNIVKIVVDPFLTGPDDPCQEQGNCPPNGRTTDPPPGIYGIQTGQDLTVTAYPFFGWQFDHWEGAATASANPITLTSPHRELKAVFVSPLVFEDANLEWVVRETIGKMSGTLTQDDLDTVTTLIAPNMGICSLAGINNCRNLTDLDLQYNSISDLQP